LDSKNFYPNPDEPAN